MDIWTGLRNGAVALVALGVLLGQGAADAGQGKSRSVKTTTTTTTVVKSGGDHVCRYEKRPLTRTFRDSSGGSYEQTTYERVRVCTHETVAYRAPVATKVYVEERRTTSVPKRKVNVSIGVGYHGSPSVYVGVSSYPSSYYYPSHYYGSYYSPYALHHYGHHSYGHHYSHHYSSHRGHHYGHH